MSFTVTSSHCLLNAQKFLEVIVISGASSSYPEDFYSNVLIHQRTIIQQVMSHLIHVILSDVKRIPYMEILLCSVFFCDVSVVHLAMVSM